MHATFSGHSTLRVLPREYKLGEFATSVRSLPRWNLLTNRRTPLGGLSVTPIFDHLGAASWHRGDADAIKKIGDVVTWLLVPWKIVAITFIGLAGCFWCCRRRMRRAQKNRAEDVELFDMEREMLLESGGQAESGSGRPSEHERRNLLMRLWRDSISAPSPNDEEGHRSMSPSSRVSSSDSTLREDADELDEMKERKMS